MIWFGVIGILLILAIVVVLMSYIHGDCYFSRVKDNDQLSIEVRALFGLVKYRYVIPVIQFKGFTKGVYVKSETVDQTQSSMKGEDKNHITKDKVLDFFQRARQALEHTLKLYDWMKITISKVECSHLSWVTRVGLGDAPQTAITTGAIWALKSSLLGFGIRYVNLQTKPKVFVTPQYNEMHFSTEFLCKGRIKVWHVLWAGIQLIVRISKVKGGIRTWYELLRKPRMKHAS